MRCLILRSWSSKQEVSKPLEKYVGDHLSFEAVTDDTSTGSDGSDQSRPTSRRRSMSSSLFQVRPLPLTILKLRTDALRSLSRRLDMSDPSTPSTSKLPSLVDGRVSPTDLLWQIKRSLLSVRLLLLFPFLLSLISLQGEYVPDLFVTLTASRSLYQAPPLNSASKGKGRFTSWNDAPWESSFHALSAALWSELGEFFSLPGRRGLTGSLGSTSLEELRNGIALKALDGDTNVWDVRLAVLSRQAALVCLFPSDLRFVLTFWCSCRCLRGSTRL